MNPSGEQSAWRKRERRLAFFFVLPSLAVFILFMFYPLLYTLYLSFFRWNMVSPKMKFVSVDNYVNLLTDPVTVTIAENTLLYIVILVLFNFLLPYVLAFVNTFLMKRGSMCIRRCSSRRRSSRSSWERSSSSGFSIPYPDR